MITVKLHGALAKTFGKQFKFEVKDTAEAFRALIYQLKGFRQLFQDGYYKVRIGNRYLDSNHLQQGLYQPIKSNTIINIIPVIQGSSFFKKFGMIIAGVVIIVASIISYQSYGVSYGTAMMMGSFGASLAMSGVAQLLAPTPKMPGINNNDEQKSKSSAFSGLENLTPQGRPVPLVYGEILTGGIIISQGLETRRVNEKGMVEAAENNQDNSGSVWGVA